MSISLYQSLAQDYRNKRIKEAELIKIKNKLSKKPSKKLNEAVNINVSPDNNVNINIDNDTPVVAEPVEEPIEVASEEPKDKDEELLTEEPIEEADVIAKNPTERGEIEFGSYINIIKDAVKDVFGNIENVDITSDFEESGSGAAYVQFIAKPKEDIPSENNKWFGISINDTEFGAPISLGDNKRVIEFYIDGQEEPASKEIFDGATPISELKSKIVKFIKKNSATIKEITDLDSIAQYRKDNNITDSEDLKEGCNKEEKDEDKKSIVKEDEEEVISDEEVEEKVEDEPSIDTKEEAIDFLIKDEQIAIDGYDKVFEKLDSYELSDEDKELFITKLNEIKADEENHIEILKGLLEGKDIATNEEVAIEGVPEEFEECEITSYKITRVAPKYNAYMLEAQTKDGLKYITGKNFNETDKTLDEAEIANSKLEASNRFKSFLK